MTNVQYILSSQINKSSLHVYCDLYFEKFQCVFIRKNEMHFTLCYENYILWYICKYFMMAAI